MSPLPSLPSNYDQKLAKLRGALTWTERIPSDYDFPMPVMVSHAANHAKDESRLRNYAQQVIAGRMMQFTYITTYKLNNFLSMYLDGFESKNFYSMLFSARSMIETFAVAFDLFDHIKSNAGDHGENFTARVISVDKALITATFGTRSDVVKDVFPKIVSSRLRGLTDDDLSTIQAKNIITRIDRSAKKSGYSDCRQHYDKLCEYLHPNIGQNLILCWPSPKNAKWVRISRASELSMASAFRASIDPAIMASEQIMREMSSPDFPFGNPVSGTKPGA